MRTALAQLVGLLIPTMTLAASPEKLYFIGEAKISSGAGEAQGSQIFLLEKTHDRDKSTIVERAVVVQSDGSAKEWTMRLAVKPDNTFTLTDDSGKAAGSGTLFGPAWKWTYFKASYKAGNGVQIDDENFMADDSAITARKKIAGPDGKVIVYMDMTLKAITPKTFEILKTALVKK